MAIFSFLTTPKWIDFIFWFSSPPSRALFYHPTPLLVAPHTNLTKNELYIIHILLNDLATDILEI